MTTASSWLSDAPRSMLAALAAIVSVGCSSDLGDGTTGGPTGMGGSAMGVGGSVGGSSAGGSGATAGGSGATAGAGGATAGASGAGGAAPGSGGTSGAGSAGTAGSGGSAGGGRSPGCGTMAATGQSQQQMTAFGLERGYYLSVPDSYSPDVPHRLIFGYHGSNYSGVRMRTYLDLEEGPLASGTIFVYPDGLPLDGQPDHIAWELDADGRDIAFFDELYAKLSSEYCIDTDRIFVNGQSFGGLMTNAVGCHRGDVVRAIAVVAGSGPRSETCQGEVAVWLTHGMDDESVDFSSGEASRDHWVEANGCAMTTTPGDPAQCQNYDGCREGYPVIWCPHVDDGGHQHPSFGREAVREFLAGF
jgi:polyhydroxybutyrate depolymerase